MKSWEYSYCAHCGKEIQRACSADDFWPWLHTDGNRRCSLSAAPTTERHYGFDLWEER